MTNGMKSDAVLYLRNLWRYQLSRLFEIALIKNIHYIFRVNGIKLVLEWIERRYSLLHHARFCGFLST